jgi:hypothetical protein
MGTPLQRRCSHSMRTIDAWRDKAAALREWARREPDIETCRLLLALADDYDQVAADLESLLAPVDV